MLRASAASRRRASSPRLAHLVSEILREACVMRECRASTSLRADGRLPRAAGSVREPEDGRLRKSETDLPQGRGGTVGMGRHHRRQVLMRDPSGRTAEHRATAGLVRIGGRRWTARRDTAAFTGACCRRLGVAARCAPPAIAAIAPRGLALPGRHGRVARSPAECRRVRRADRQGAGGLRVSLRRSRGRPCDYPRDRAA